MFERLIVRAQSPLHPEQPLDLGVLVEGALFYGETELVLTPQIIKQIAQLWTPEGLIELLDCGLLKIRYQHNIAGIRTNNTGTNRERYEPVVFEVVSAAGVSSGPELLIGRVLEQVIGRRGRARRVTAQVCRKLNVERIDDAIAHRVTSDLLDTSYVESAVRQVLRLQTPELELPNNMRFEVQQVADGLRVLSNIDFDIVNTAFARHVAPSQATITPAFLLAHFLTARELLEDAAKSGADMAADAVNACVAEIRIDRLLDRRNHNEAMIRRFQDLVLDDGRAIREAVNSGRATLPDILRLLENATKFRSWIEGQKPDADLVREYFREATSTTWVDRLPSKVIRWLLFSGAGIGIDLAGLGGLGTALGVTLGAVDSILLDSIIRGWKPNQFVESSLRRFVKR